MATDQLLQTNWEIHLLMLVKMRISLDSWTVSTETDQGSDGHPLPEPFPGAPPAYKGSI